MGMIRNPSFRAVPLMAIAGALFLTSLACSSFSSPSASPTAKPTKTLTPVKTAIPSKTSAPTATEEQNSDNWTVILSETFDSNKHDWYTGVYDGDYIQETVSIEDGKYKWDTLAKDSTMDYGSPDIGSLGDFIVSMEGRQISGSENAEYGVMFRASDEGDYTFGINENTGEFYLVLYFNEDNTFLIDYTTTSAIRQGEPNQLSVTAVGSHFDLFINGEKVGEADDSSVPSGEVAIALYLSDPGDAGVFEFDNFEVSTP
jgi:hypothetical protein